MRIQEKIKSIEAEGESLNEQIIDFK